MSKPAISYPDQCCKRYCIEDIGVHNVDQETAEWVARQVAIRESIAALEALQRARKVLSAIKVLGRSSMAEGGKIGVRECTETLDRIIVVFEDEMEVI